MAERLTPRDPDLEVHGSSLARRVVSLDKELYSTLSFVYKWVPVSRPGGVAVLLAMLHDKETVINSSCFGPLASVRFYILPFTCCK